MCPLHKDIRNTNLCEKKYSITLLYSERYVMQCHSYVIKAV